jgi:4-carboxymuconolactone decarboxylase
MVAQTAISFCVHRFKPSFCVSEKLILYTSELTKPPSRTASNRPPISNIMSSDPKYDELHKQLFDEGLKMRRSVVGDEYVDRALANGSSEFARAGQELVTEFCWGYAWTRPGLTKQQRSLINIGMLMALNRAPELAVHVRGARNNGLSELEIREAIIHATTYCGVPAGVDAMKTAEKVLNEMAEKGEMPREMGKKSDRA